jgi:hypothetical protein
MTDAERVRTALMALREREGVTPHEYELAQIGLECLERIIARHPLERLPDGWERRIGDYDAGTWGGPRT